MDEWTKDTVLEAINLLSNKKVTFIHSFTIQTFTLASCFPRKSLHSNVYLLRSVGTVTQHDQSNECKWFE